MAFDPSIDIGETISNDQLRAIFGCSPQGGMRFSKKTKTLVLVSDHVKSTYEDRWDSETLHYTGMGQVGDQSIDFMQNRTLANSPHNNIDIFLFEVFKKNAYQFYGRVQLSAEPYFSRQLDRNDNDRKVIIFPLQRIVSDLIPPPYVDSEQAFLLKLKKAKNLSDQELLRKAKNAKKISSHRTLTTQRYERDANIAVYTKRRAQGKCDLCKEDAPFKDKNGDPYLENHHITWLSQGGEDSIENTVALCPNCHKRMHILNSSSDVQRLLTLNKSREKCDSLSG